LAERGEQNTLNQWQPTADYLRQRIPGYYFTVVPLGFERIGQTVAADEVTTPEMYVDFEMRYGAGRLATLRNRINGSSSTDYGEVVFTRADRDDIQDLTDLVSKKFRGGR
jgi:hypothetical protein